MEKIQNILWSLIPLILIVVLSWLFSFLGAKKKEESAGLEGTDGARAGDQFLDFFAQGEEKDEVMGERLTREQELPGESWGSIQTSHPAFRGPEVNAKPIKPKWWGA